MAFATPMAVRSGSATGQEGVGITLVGSVEPDTEPDKSDCSHDSTGNRKQGGILGEDARPCEHERPPDEQSTGATGKVVSAKETRAHSEHPEHEHEMADNIEERRACGFEDRGRIHTARAGQLHEDNCTHQNGTDRAQEHPDTPEWRSSTGPLVAVETDESEQESDMSAEDQRLPPQLFPSADRRDSSVRGPVRDRALQRRPRLHLRPENCHSSVEPMFGVIEDS